MPRVSTFSLKAAPVGSTSVPTTDGERVTLDQIKTHAQTGTVLEARTSTTGLGFVVDEDNMTSDSDTKLPTQQSVKAYVDPRAIPTGGISGQALVKTSNADRAVGWATIGGGGGGAAIYNPFAATVIKTSGNTIAIDRTGAVISSLATTNANNATVIQAAIDVVAGTQDLPGSGSASGYGGGGTVFLADQEFVVSTTITLKYGVSLRGLGSIDRHGLSNYNQSVLGTVLRAASGFAGPILAIGSTASVSRSTTNPHSTTVAGIVFAGYAATASLYGIRIRDTGHLRLQDCWFNGFRGSGAVAIKLESTRSPDEGSLGCEIIECWFTDNDKHLVCSGTGSTDGRIVGGRWLQHLTAGVELGLSGGGGGWQIMGGHWTTGSDAYHINADASPLMVTGNYFDTTGTGTGGNNYHIKASSGGLLVASNHFKCSGSGGPQAPIQLSGNGKKCTITGNQLLAGSGTKAFVEIDSAANQYVIQGNNLDNDGAAWVAPVILPAGTSVANAAGSGRWIDMNPLNAMS